MNIKKHLFVVLSAFLFAGVSLIAQTPKTDAMSALSSMMASMEMMNGEVLKIYSAQDHGATFTGYVVTYKGNEVVVTDLLHMGNPKKVGDKINFAAQQIEMPPKSGNKVLQFTVMPGSPN